MGTRRIIKPTSMKAISLKLPIVMLDALEEKFGIQYTVPTARLIFEELEDALNPTNFNPLEFEEVVRKGRGSHKKRDKSLYFSPMKVKIMNETIFRMKEEYPLVTIDRTKLITYILHKALFKPVSEQDNRQEIVTSKLLDYATKNKLALSLPQLKDLACFLASL